MGCCSGRCILISICLLQLICTIERQVFDFLGYMWVPIIVNFLQIILVIIGLFGAIQFRHRVVIVYTAWTLLWLGWNIFVICFYLEVGILHRGSSVLNIGTGNRSWWRSHGLGCEVSTAQNTTCVQSSVSSVPDSCLTGCLVQYYYVEILHAGVQCLLALLGFCVSCYVIYVFTEEDDSSQPVHDELQYIKMRYQSPARRSFRAPATGPPSPLTKTPGQYGTNRGYTDTQTSTYRGTDADHSSLEMTPTRQPQYPSNTDNDVINTDSTRSNRKMLPPSDRDDVSNYSSSPKKKAGGTITSNNNASIGSSSKNPDLWITNSPNLPRADYGYESYDSRHQLVVGAGGLNGQSVI